MKEVKNLPCSKCHCQWPPNQVYCICGEKLQKRTSPLFEQFQAIIDEWGLSFPGE